MFKAFGHDRVSIMDGGMQHWKQQGRPVSTRPADAVPPGHFVASPQPNRVRSKAEVARNLLSHEALVVDARGAPRYSGEEKETLPGWATGHIPASVNLPFMTLSDAATGLMLPPDLLGKRAESVGVSLSRPVIAPCRTGISACVVAFTLERLGHGSVSVYDGSWAEWGTDPASPVETGKGSNQ